MTQPRLDAIARNAKAVRVSLLAAGLIGQFAMLPVVPWLAWGLAAVALLGVGIASLRMPVLAATPEKTDHAGRRWQRSSWPARQVIALGLIVVAAIDAAVRLRAGDAAAEGRTLAILLLLVQVAHAIASRTRREMALGCGVVVAMLAVAAVFAGDVTLLPSMVLGLAAIAVTSALLHRGSLLESADAVSAGTTASAVQACVAPVAVAVVIGIVMFLVLPNSNALQGHPRLGGLRASGQGFVPQRDVRGVGAVGASTLDLRARGSLSSDPVLSTDAAAPQYWQGAIYDYFDGLTWRSNRVSYDGLWTPSGPIGAGGRPTQIAPSIPANSADARTDTATVLSAQPLDVVLAPGAPTSYSGAGRVASDADGTAHLLGGGPGEGATYQVTSMAGDVPDGELRATTGPDPADPRWTALPATLAPRVRDLAAQLTNGAATRFDAVEAVENYLKTNETYDLDSPQPQPGDDAVDDFVFVSHRGFCEQFATAAVVMLRSAGVPARLVTGYAFGDTSRQPGHRVFRVEDAHAWVQVYYPGFGWVASDATPSGVTPSSAGASASVRQQIATALEHAWHRVPGGRTGALVIVLVLSIIGVILVAVAGRFLARRRRRAQVVRSDDDGPVLAAYLRLERALVDAGQARLPGETLGDFARRLGGLVASPGDVASAMRCLERECYARGPRRPSAGEATQAIEVFGRLEVAAGSQRVVVAAGSDPGGQRR
jgi:transglutaminase-like putative cysteine protease